MKSFKEVQQFAQVLVKKEEDLSKILAIDDHVVVIIDIGTYCQSFVIINAPECI